MASNPIFQVPHHREVDRFQWQQGHPDEPEERQIGVDPFSLRQLSRVDIDRPLPIPSVSVDDQHLPAYAPARSASASSSVPQSPRLSSAGAAPARWDAHLALARSATSSVPEKTKAVSRSKSFADGEMELARNEFDVVLSSPERRASTPQRWGSDVPLIEDARRRKGKHGTAPFGCCLYLPGLTRRNRPPSPPLPHTDAARSSSGSPPATFRGPEAVIVDADPEPDGPGTARQSTMSLAVSLEGFECRFSSRSSGGLALEDDDDDDDDEEATPSSSYFDLPLELILGCDAYGDGDTGLPMHAAFMFDSDGIRKSVLKNGVRHAAATAKVSGDASGTDRIPARHHVRFAATADP